MLIPLLMNLGMFGAAVADKGQVPPIFQRRLLKSRLLKRGTQFVVVSWPELPLAMAQLQHERIAASTTLDELRVTTAAGRLRWRVAKFESVGFPETLGRVPVLRRQRIAQSMALKVSIVRPHASDDDEVLELLN